jgi:two-component system response regulator MprA
MDTRILIVDDDEKIRTMLRRSLSADGFQVSEAADGEKGLASLRAEVHDLVVLDVGLPGIDGFDVCRTIRREKRTVPVLLLTARGDVTDRVTGLEAGADDYLPKPFAYEELLARVRALVRRTRPTDSSEPLIVADVVLDPDGRTCRRGTRNIELSRREFDLLELLMRNARATIERWKIIEDVWDDSIEIESNAVEVYIGYLRKKLEADGEPRLIHTVRGIGYSFRAQGES